MPSAAPVRTLVVWCPDWPVAAAGVAPGVAAAVLHANRVVACSAAARHEGVAVGQRRREAQGRCPALEVLEHDPARDARAFEAVAAAVTTFTPRVEITAPGTCAFATRGPSRYFGGDRALGERLVAAVREALGATRLAPAVRVGVADGPFAAALAAQVVADGAVHVVPPGASGAFLAPCPVGVLGAGRPAGTPSTAGGLDELVDVLARLGVTTLGGLAQLPLTDVIGRFGATGERAHRLASGLDDRPPDAAAPPPDLRVTAELDPPAERIEQVAFVARSLADGLHGRLGDRGLACTRVVIEAETEHGEHLVRVWRDEGALSSAAIADRVRWQLDGWLHAGAGARPTGGIVHLALAPDEVVPATGRQLGFWGGETAADERALRGLARVQALIGVDAVLVPEHHGGRGPDEAVRLVPIVGVDVLGRIRRAGEQAVTGARRRVAQPAAAPPPWPGQLPAPHPASVHPEPRPIAVLDERGEPVRVDARGLLSAAPATLASASGGGARAVASWAGPWPVEERWWDTEARRRLVRLQVVTDDGSAHLVELEGGAWRLAATYD